MGQHCQECLHWGASGIVHSFSSVCLLKNKIDLICEECFLALVPLHVQRQVVRPGEAAAAHAALERLRPGVFPEMASQLIGTGEAPLTSLPGALIRFLSCVGP